MGDNTLGRRFRITSFGESHGVGIGVVIDGVPAGLMLDINFIQQQLDLRKPGGSNITSNRKEEDKVRIFSGLFNGNTTGAPLCLIIENKDQKPADYEKIKDILRPSHADYSALKRYGGFADYRGSGRFSGRITAGYVMAGAIAKQILFKYGIEVFSYTMSIGDIEDIKDYSLNKVEDLLKKREESNVRTLDKELSKLMEGLIYSVKNKKDSIGGSISCIIKGIPPGIGDPIFNSLESNISKAIFSIPAVRGIEFGAGFEATKMKGSEHNDPWTMEGKRVITVKNDSGGILGGISTGMPIIFHVAFKPTSSIGVPQNSVSLKDMTPKILKIKGRHDPCIVPRAVVIVESLAALVIVDFLLINGTIPNVLK